jgi:ribosomal protein S3
MMADPSVIGRRGRRLTQLTQQVQCISQQLLEVIKKCR